MQRIVHSISDLVTGIPAINHGARFTTTGWRSLDLPEIDVRTKGALCDGSTDDTAAVADSFAMSTLATPRRIIAANTPILRAPTNNTHSIRISDLNLEFLTQSDGSDTNAYGIQWGPSSGGGDGYFNWVVERVRVHKAYIGMGHRINGGSVALWNSTGAGRIDRRANGRAFAGTL